jgi:hypothetical protein
VGGGLGGAGGVGGGGLGGAGGLGVGDEGGAVGVVEVTGLDAPLHALKAHAPAINNANP